MESCLSGSPNVLPSCRHTAKFPPTVWRDHHFNSYLQNQQIVCEWKEKAETLKRELLKLLKEDPKLKLKLIDEIQRLGVAYHFEQEIENEIQRIFTTSYDHALKDDDQDLYTAALRFRLLREHGYKLTPDVFRKFVDDKGKFHKTLCDDVDGLLNLYEAAHLRVHGETILDNALVFTTNSLRSLLPQLSPSLAKQVGDALYRPLHKRIPRLEARNYLYIYEQKEEHNETLLHFAKLDFNILQSLHQKELSFILKWWKDMDCSTKFPFARNRIVEGYFWILGVYFEPQYTTARRFLTQVIATTSIIDDMYDAYGTFEELELFTNAVQRWDVSAIVHLPKYMKPCYQQVLDVFHKTEEEMIEEDKTRYGVVSAKKAMKGLLRVYMEERIWLQKRYIPTVEEYMEVALVSTGYLMLSVSSLVWMGDFANEQVFDWFFTQPKVLNAATVICRLMDDIVSHKFEQERGHPPSAVECYTKQHKVSEKKACEVFRAEIEEAWKDINEGLLRPTDVPMPVLLRVLNLTRVVELLHKESDGYTHITPAVKGYITSLLCNAVHV